MAEVSAAEKAYEAALREIERVREKGRTELTLSGEDFYDLDRIPSEVAAIEGLKYLNLSYTRVSDLSPLRGLTQLGGLHLIQTAVSDLSPLKGMTALRSLWLDDTAVSDLSPLREMIKIEVLSLKRTEVSNLFPLRKMTSMRSLELEQTAVYDISPLRAMTLLNILELNQTEVSDLAPLAKMTALRGLSLYKTKVQNLHPLSQLSALQGLLLDNTGVADLRPLVNLSFEDLGVFSGLSFADTPSTLHDPELQRLSHLKGPKQRTRETLAYLKTLPPWPKPLPVARGSIEIFNLNNNGDPAPSPAAQDRDASAPPSIVPRKITLNEARQVLESNSPHLRARCQHVVADLDDALAMQAVRIPNEPEQLVTHTAITNSLTLAKAALMGLHDALPEDDLNRPVTEAEVTALRTAFDALLEKLKSAAAYVDRSDHTPTYGGLLKMGCATGIASVLCLFPGVAMTAAIPGVYTMLYGGPAAVKALGEIGKKAGGA